MEDTCEKDSCESECNSAKCCENTCASSCCGCSSCDSSSCCESECDDSSCSMTEMMMELVHEASAELIKERVKKKLDAINGKKYDKIADLLVEAKMEYMKSQGSVMKQKELSQKLMSALFEE